MNKSSNQKIIPGAVAIVETILLFIVSILGDKISSLLEIEPLSLLYLTGIGLTVLAIISYMNSGRFETTLLPPTLHTKPSELNVAKEKKGIALWKFVPKTMIGMFPFGILIGFVSGLILPNLVPTTGTGEIPLWEYIPFTFPLSNAEATGVYIGVLISIVLALIVDGYLGGALAIGFGLAFPIALVQTEVGNVIFAFGGWSQHGVPQTYIGHILGFSIFGLLLIIAAPLLKKFRPTLQKLWEMLTQPRVT